MIMRNSKIHRFIYKYMWRDEKGRNFEIDFLAMASYTTIKLFQKEVVTKRKFFKNTFVRISRSFVTMSMIFFRF